MTERTPSELIGGLFTLLVKLDIFTLEEVLSSSESVEAMYDLVESKYTELELIYK